VAAAAAAALPSGLAAELPEDVAEATGAPQSVALNNAASLHVNRGYLQL
jgi:hypothetical protein